MPTNRIAWFLTFILFLFFAGAAYITIVVYKRLHQFGIEGQIHSTFYPLAAALYRYEKENGRAARSLGVLVPRYLQTIPASELADPPTYRVGPNGDTWELVIHSRALPQPRLYICRSTQHFTAEEKRRLLLYYHFTWAVFPTDT